MHRHSHQLLKLLDDLSEGDSPEIDSYLVDWGLSVKVAASMTRNHTVRLTAACHVIADNLQKGHHAMLRVLLVFILAHFALGHDNVGKEPLHWTMAGFTVLYVYRRVNRSRSLHRLYDLLVSADVPEYYPRAFHTRKSVSRFVYGVIHGTLALPSYMFMNVI